MKAETKLLLEKIFKLTFGIFFIIYLWIPIVKMDFKFAEVKAGSDKEKLSGIPIFNPRYPTESILSFENYFGENFGLRNQLITLNNNLIIFTTGYSKQAKVVLGHDGWLYFEEGLVDNWRRPPYTYKQLVDIKNDTVTVKDKLAANGIRYVMVIAPDKHNIYPQYLPNDFKKIATNQRASQRINYLKENTDIAIVDLRQPLLSAREKYQTYYKADTHWNSYGSFIGYQEVMKELKSQFPNLEPLELDDFNITVSSKQNTGDMAKNLAIYDKFNDKEITLTLKEGVKEEKLTKDKKLKKAVVYLDSFFSPGYSWTTLQYLRHHFDVVLDFPNHEAYDYEMLMNQKPDVVIYEIVERHL